MGQLIDLTGQRFGKLTVLKRDYSKKGGTYWICQCDCGNIISTRKDTLTRTKNSKKSCGCDLKERISKANLKNEIGNKYGKLTVLERVEDLRPGEARWKCQCECGNITYVSGVHLRNGSVQSCGCKRFESHNGIDETGKRYGNLTVLEQDEKRTHVKGNSHIFWKCKCDCGNICSIRGTYLRQGISTNCGCKRSVGEDKIKTLFDENNILYKREYTFSDLVGQSGGYLRYDFGVLDETENLLYLIEYDGIQHFNQNCFGKDEQDFITLKEHDELKTNYAKEHNIPLIRINYQQLKTLSLEDIVL